MSRFGAWAVLSIAIFFPSRSTAADDHDPQSAVAQLDAAAGVEATLFASEPMLTNPADIDIDHLGRVWVCDVHNYRGHNGSRPAGDRILVLTDRDSDGKADDVTTFYQGRDIDSTLGICVLGNKVIVSCSPNVFVFTDDDGDAKADRKELLFTKTGQPQHDHSAHAFVFGPDGKLYWNFGNSGHSVHDKNGRPIVDLAGNTVNERGQPYRGGMTFRCDLDGGQFEVLGHNFRNDYEVAVDSFGTLWQSDNDDDGNRGVRINYVMEFGNYGFLDERTGASWSTPYTGQPSDVSLRHWHLTDPGVVPNVLQTGAGSPSGIMVYEGDLLPAVFRNQMIHCDPGPNVARAYPVTADGAGYKAEIVNLLHGARNQWFRPIDVCAAPDGSLIVADWYDPGVGGHNQGELERGRLFRVAPPGTPYRVPKFDVSTAEGAIEALKNPNLSARYLGWTKLRELGREAEPALLKLYKEGNPRLRARALWLLSKLPDNRYIVAASFDTDASIRVTGIRAARQTGEDILPIVRHLARDPSPHVRRECAIALAHLKSPEAAAAWADLAIQHTGDDRWYLEALGIGAMSNWDACFAAWQERAKDSWNSPGGRDIIWRSRSKQAIPWLARLIADPSISAADRVRFFRGLEFHDNASKQQVLADLLKVDGPHRPQITALALKQLHGGDASKVPEIARALNQALDAAKGTATLLELVEAFSSTDRYDDVLALALDQPETSTGVAAARLLFRAQQKQRFDEPVSGDDATAAKALTVLGLSQEEEALDLISSAVTDAKRSVVVRAAGVAALGRSRLGEQGLFETQRENRLPGELHFAAAKALQASADDQVRAEAAERFPVPAAAESELLPPLAELIRQNGDAERGKQVFENSGTCAKCHTVNGKGGDIGPNLSEIGAKLSREAQFESILFPNAGIAQNFESYTLELDSGNVVTGLIMNEAGDSISIKGADAILHTFKKSEVVNRKKQTVSLMPADLQKTMTADDLVDVVEYVMTLKKAQ